ncbi:hypothetical protein J6590_067038 [Homalodisca vitripennis]|nr:hypothetical protein J6590_067038 [Homalodisca vitripennis]
MVIFQHEVDGMKYVVILLELCESVNEEKQSTSCIGSGMVVADMDFGGVLVGASIGCERSCSYAALLPAIGSGRLA